MLLEMPDQDLEPIHQMAESAYLELISYNDPGAATYACVTLSEVELRQSNYEGAHFYVDKGLLELPAEIPGPRISLLIQRARVFARSGDYSQSQDFVEEAIAMMESAAPSTTLANSWALVARVLVEIGLAERGIYAYEQAIQVAGILREEPEIQIK